jgi:uncharacterized protein YlzI (FlbEa/FlbD family)
VCCSYNTPECILIITLIFLFNKKPIEKNEQYPLHSIVQTSFKKYILNADMPKVIEKLKSGLDELSIKEKRRRGCCMDFPVDIVYLWSSGSETRLRLFQDYVSKEKSKEIAKCEQNFSLARVLQNDEIKYALRSIAKNMNWVRNIYIIIDDNEYPQWLNISNSRIKLVNTSDIIDKQYLPVFNSNLIEGNVYKIKGLSEQFLMSCDDCLVMLPTDKNFFFDEYKRPIYRIKPYESRKDNPYKLHINFCNQMAYLATGKEWPDLVTTYHGIQPHSLKSITKTITNSFLTPYYKLMLSHRFRKTTDMDHLLFALVGESRGEYWVKHSAIHEYIKSKSKEQNWIKNVDWTGDIRMIINKDIHWYKKINGVRQISIDAYDKNDITGLESYNEIQKHFMNEWFPEKSEFEI